MDTRRSVFREDRGAIAVTVAILLIVFLGLAALSVDMGYLYTVKRQLQSSADAAALAGVRELLEGANETGVLAVAEEYAELNAEIPADGLVMLTEAPLTEVGSNYVRVTVEKESPLFFGRMWAADPTIQATAEARVAYVTGMRGLVPLGLPILRATRVHAWFDGNPGGGSDLSYDPVSGTWKGNVPVAAMNAGTSRNLNLDLYNSQDYKETLLRVSNVHAVALTQPFQSVNAMPGVIVNHPDGRREPSSVSVQVVATGGTTLRFNGQTPTGSDSYARTFPAPSTTDLRTVFPVDLFVGDRATGQPDLRAGALVNSVRSTYPMQLLSVSPRYFQPGAAGSVNVEVGLHDYEYGELYHLKLSGDGEAGNFGPVTFEGGGANAFRTDLTDGYTGVVTIGQIIDTEPGVQTGPTSQALQSRLVGPGFDEWVAAGMPRDSRRLVYVPVVEHLNPIAGRSEPVVVVSFAAFYLEDAVGAADIWGRFVEYILPSDVYSEDPPGTGMYLETYRLVTPETER